MFRRYMFVALILLISNLGLTSPTLSNTSDDRKALASGYALIEVEDFLANAARLDWLPQGDWIAYDKRETDGYNDVYQIQPDGTDNECLTCNHPALPNKHIGNPAFHPDGRWLLFQAEKQNHEWSPSTNPGGGAYNDLYVIDLESESPYDVYQLTDVRSGYPVGGSLHAHFSRDGEQLLWGDLEGGGGCFGDWRIAIAGFDDQAPALTNVTYYEPGDNTEWYEMEDWSLDDSGIYFSCAPLSGQDDRTMDFCYLDLETEELARLTETSGLSGEPDEWEEHGKITPLGDAITWMTSTGYEINYGNCRHVEWLETDLWIKNADGTGKTKLTHYNEPGYPEYDPDGVCVSDMSWNPEGTKLAVEVYFRGIQTAKMKIFHFSRCGDGVCDGSETVENCPQDCAEAPDYEVVSITTLTTDGGRVDWSHDGQWIYYDHFEPDGFYDVYRIHPDGTGNECVTCDRPELPNNNQGQPQMHPNGRYLVFQAEKAEHAGTVGDPATGPGGGYYNDLWALDLETGNFHQLTDARSGLPAGGSLHSHFSNDGTKLLWSDLERYDGRFGDWQLAVADFVTSPSPHLENHQYYNPGPQPIWLEAHGWGPDDSWIYFTCTPVAGMDDNDQDICWMDLETEALSRLTFTSGLNSEAGEWDEHAHLSPLHDAFSWMSSTPYGTESIGDYGQWLRTELWLMNADGSDQRRITFFNATEQVIVADNDWNPAATGNQQLAVTMFMRDRDETHIKIIEFSVADRPYWPSFGYDRRNASRSPHTGPKSARLAWTYPAVKGRVINQQQTVDVDGTIYFATWGSYIEGTGNRARGMLYAINPGGSLKWIYDPGELEDYYLGTIETSPTIGPDGTIYIGRSDGILRAVNPDGTLKWTFETIPNTNGRGHILTSPVIGLDGTIYFGTSDYILALAIGNNVFYALEDKGDHAEIKWTFPSDATEGGSLDHGIWSNPAIAAAGTVYFSSGFKTYAINPDGTERWSKTTIRNMYNPVVGEDGTVYVQAMYQMGGTGAIYALNPDDGSRKWVYTVEEPTVTKVAIAADGTLYVGSGTHEVSDEPQNIGKLYALTDEGDHAETRWAYDFGLSVGAPTLDAMGTIYVALRGDLDATPPIPGRVVALRDTGSGAEIIWSVEATGEIWLAAPVIGPDRTLYFADAVCLDYEVCDEDTDVPSLYAIKEVQHSVYLPVVFRN